MRLATTDPVPRSRAVHHRRRRLTSVERVRICEEYLAGYDTALIVERWNLTDEHALRSLVTKVMSLTARRIRLRALGAK